jgi:hypothetical protein
MLHDHGIKMYVYVLLGDTGIISMIRAMYENVIHLMPMDILVVS